MNRLHSAAILSVTLLCSAVVLPAAAQKANQPPKGFAALFNGKDLTGWRGRQPNYDPLAEADNPVGQWNTFHIRMVGPKVWVRLNDKLTVDRQVLDNFFDRAQPVAAEGPIELQTHGSEIRFRNVFVRELQEK